MKKGIIALFFLSLIFIFTNKSEEIIIPKEAIRFRVIANSNSIKDQMTKEIIKDDVENKVYSLINSASNTTEVRRILQNNLEEIENIIKSYNIKYSLNYGLNYFPVKHYKGVIYPEGKYESLVITLGNGIGDNFWCVLYPPLCLIDNKREDVGEVQYRYYVKDLLEKF